MKHYLRRHYSVILTAGFAVFAMFFGAGNLVFPLSLGAQTTDLAGFASIGWCLTGVLVPFLGLLATIAYEGDYKSFFKPIGRFPAFLLITLMMLLLGPLCGVPRCIIVAYSGFDVLCPWMPFWLFSLIFGLLNWLAIGNGKRLVAIIGAWLTPWFLISILGLLITGFMQDVPVSPIQSMSPSNAINLGTIMGYQTLDLLATFFFCTAVTQYIRSHIAKQECNTRLIPLSLATCVIGAGLLALVYLALIYLGAYYAPLIHALEPRQMLLGIAEHALGRFAVLAVSLTILMACLTTTAALIALAAEFFGKSVARDRLHPQVTLIGTIAISCLVSLSGFDAIFKLLASILQILYPSILSLVLASLFAKATGRNFIRPVFWSVTCVCVFLSCM